MPEKAKNKTNLQQRVALRITLPKIILLQSDTKASKIMFPAAKNDWAKNAKNKAKKQNKLSTVHFTSYYLSLSCALKNDNKASKIMFLATQNV